MRGLLLPSVMLHEPTFLRFLIQKSHVIPHMHLALQLLMVLERVFTEPSPHPDVVQVPIQFHCCSHSTVQYLQTTLTLKFLQQSYQMLVLVFVVVIQIKIPTAATQHNTWFISLNIQRQTKKRKMYLIYKHVLFQNVHIFEKMFAFV